MVFKSEVLDPFAASPFARMVDSGGNQCWIQATHEFSLDTIGALYNNDAIWSGGNLITPATQIVGFHANIVCNDRIKDLIDASIIITPNHIQREWA